MTSPIVKWAGGKTGLLPELIPRMPQQFENYYEPFAGGAALFFAIDASHIKIGARRVLNDVNQDLIDCYRAIANDVDGVIERLSWHVKMHSDDHYYAVREDHNNRLWLAKSTRAADTIYLNKTCFNGLWRVNSKGEFNVPMGRTANGEPPKILDAEALRAAGAALQRAALRCGGYLAAALDATAGDFVYFDPPYDPVSETANFTAYDRNQFDANDQQCLAKYALEFVRRGVYVMLSNADTPRIRALYPTSAGWHIDVVSRAGTMNSKASERQRVRELIITGGYQR